MKNYFLVSLGASLGGVFRYWVTSIVHIFMPATFPYGTLTVNVIGSFVLGFIIYFLDPNELIEPHIRTFLTIGFCGAFTTFSTFSVETLNLLRESEYFLAGMNILLNLSFSLVAALVAFWMAKVITGG